MGGLRAKLKNIGPQLTQSVLTPDFLTPAFLMPMAIEVSTPVESGDRARSADGSEIAGYVDIGR
jgi:hypothetical protein